MYHLFDKIVKPMLFLCLFVNLTFSLGKTYAQTNPLGLKIHHATISVRNADSLSNWYVNTLGFKILKTFTNDERHLVLVGIPGFRIDLLQKKNSSRPAFQNQPAPNHMLSQGIRHLVFEPENFDQAYDYLKEKGVIFFGEKPEIKTGSNQTIYFKDPEGNILELIKEH
jgi:catechol 2,3-dioxygenase-like lactoylglutathione lyase family enzyme